MELVRQDVGVGDEVKLGSAESFLHLDIVVAKAILACDLIAHREVVDPLELIEAFI